MVFRFRRPVGETEKFGLTSVEASNEAVFSTHANLYEDLYIRGFLSNIYLRPSCYSCPANGGRSQSDLTIGDFWDMPDYLQPWDDDRGTSLILVYTEKGYNLLKKMDIELRESTYEDCLVGNRTIEKSYPKPALADWFWLMYPFRKEREIEICLNIRKPSFLYRISRKIFHFYMRIIRKLIKQ